MIFSKKEIIKSIEFTIGSNKELIDSFSIFNINKEIIKIIKVYLGIISVSSLLKRYYKDVIVTKINNQESGKNTKGFKERLIKKNEDYIKNAESSISYDDLKDSAKLFLIKDKILSENKDDLFLKKPDKTLELKIDQKEQTEIYLYLIKYFNRKGLKIINNEKGIEKINKIIFSKILEVVNNKKYKEDKDIYNFISLLERALININSFSDFLYNTYYEKNLEYFRKNSKKEFNSICNNCYKKIKSNSNKLKTYCRKSDNRSCYDNKERKDDLNFRPINKNRLENIQEMQNRTKNKCDNCNKKSSLGYIYIVNNKLHQFCSKNCEEKYRKKHRIR